MSIYGNLDFLVKFAHSPGKMRFTREPRDTGVMYADVLLYAGGDS